MIMSQKANIALFIPHGGCPNNCSFCNQRRISGQQTPPAGEKVVKELERALAFCNEKRQTEIAFFGGSFTALEREYMVSLLQAAQPFLGQKGITGIRISTRPDAITPEILTILKNHGVTAIELGAQSTNNEVLAKNKRGHKAYHIEEAARLIREQGFELGLQMMTGLYGSTPQIDRQTAMDLLALSPVTMRIYPTVVFPETQLYDWTQEGLYTPPTLDETVALCSELLLLCESSGVRVIRLGLHGDSSVSGGIGPVHPALGELCLSYIYWQTVCRLLPKGWKRIQVQVHPSRLSQMIGQQKSNLKKLAAMGVACTVVPNEKLPSDMIGITRKENFHVPEIFGSTGLQILSR